MIGLGTLKKLRNRHSHGATQEGHGRASWSFIEAVTLVIPTEAEWRSLLFGLAGGPRRDGIRRNRRRGQG